MDRALSALGEDAPNVSGYADFLRQLRAKQELLIFRLLEKQAECVEWGERKVTLRGDVDIISPHLAEIRRLLREICGSDKEVTAEPGAAPIVTAPSEPLPAKRLSSGKKPEKKPRPVHPDVAHVKKYFPDAGPAVPVE